MGKLFGFLASLPLPNLNHPLFVGVRGGGRRTKSLIHSILDGQAFLHCLNMKFKKLFLIRWLILFSIFGIIVYLIFSISFQKATQRLSKRFETSSKLASAKGISFVEYHGDKKLYSVSIDSFYIERARIGPFAIGPFHIAFFNKVIIDLFQEGIESKLDQEIADNKIQIVEKKIQKIDRKNNFLNLDTTLMEIGRKLPFEAKKIKGIEVKEISINLWKEGERIFRISSNSATLDRKTKDIIFTGQANLDAGENGTLLSHRIRWDRKTHLFRVLDSYYLIRKGQRTEGKGIETDYLLKKISFISSAK